MAFPGEAYRLAEELQKLAASSLPRWQALADLVTRWRKEADELSPTMADTTASYCASHVRLCADALQKLLPAAPKGNL